MFYWFWERRVMFFVLGVFFLIFLASAARSFVLNGGYSAEWESGFWQNFSTEVLGAMATFVFFELIVNRDSEKKSLLLQLRSPDNATALNALAQIREKGWHKNGTLRKANLFGANLEGANLEAADLRSADLRGANLKRAYLKNLLLEGANLRGANLLEAQLKNARFSGAYTDDNVILPDGKNWTLDTDISLYTGSDLDKLIAPRLLTVWREDKTQ